MHSGKTLGKAIEKLRLEAGLGVGELALRAGLRPERLAGYEAGVSEPRWGTVERLLVALRTGPGALGRALEEVTCGPLDESEPIAVAILFHQEAAGLLLRVLERWPSYVEERKAQRAEPETEEER